MTNLYTWSTYCIDSGKRPGPFRWGAITTLSPTLRRPCCSTGAGDLCRSPSEPPPEERNETWALLQHRGRSGRAAAGTRRQLRGGGRHPALPWFLIEQAILSLHCTGTCQRMPAYGIWLSHSFHLPCRWRMSVTTVFKNSLACDTTINVFGHFRRYVSSHTHNTAWRSRWFVSSSSSSKSGSMNKARARAILMHHPPENSFVRLRCISGVKLRPLEGIAEHLGGLPEGSVHHGEISLCLDQII